MFVIGNTGSECANGANQRETNALDAVQSELTSHILVQPDVAWLLSLAAPSHSAPATHTPHTREPVHHW